MVTGHLRARRVRPRPHSTRTLTENLWSTRSWPMSPSGSDRGSTLGWESGGDLVEFHISKVMSYTLRNHHDPSLTGESSSTCEKNGSPIVLLVDERQVPTT